MDHKDVQIEAFPNSDRSNSPDHERGVRREKWWQFSKKDFSHVPIDIGSGSKGSSSSDLSDIGVVKNVNNVYEAAEATELYKPVEGYEGSHRFDPNATWSKQEEQKLVRRVDTSRNLSTSAQH